MTNSPKLLIRADANPFVGAGHMMRCNAISAAFRQMGGDVAFVVACDESEDFVRLRGFDVIRVEGTCRPGETAENAEASRLATACVDFEADIVLVDTYCADPDYLQTLRERAGGASVAYIDDQYRYDCGSLDVPQAMPVDLVVNYSFYANNYEYARAYPPPAPRLLLGPRFAPIRLEFEHVRRATAVAVEDPRVLITCGSTNPGGFLERMTALVASTCPRSTVDVVVGPLARVDERQLAGAVLHHNPEDMAGLMAQADIAVSAAGSTLYELASMCVPTLAIAVVENQTRNARGFEQCGLGLACEGAAADSVVIASFQLLLDHAGEIFGRLCEDRLVDARGSFRIASKLAEFC